MSLSDAASAGTLNQCINGTTFAAAGAGFAALAVNGGAEVTGTGYARQALTFGAATTANPSVTSVAAEIDFGTVGGDWTPTAIDECRVYSASTAGTLLFSDTDTTVNYASGNRAFVAAGLQITFGANTIFSASYSAAVLEWLLRAGAAPARARYLGLLNTGVELSGGNYARLDTDTLWTTATTADPSSVSFTAGAATFQASATFTGAVTHMGLYSAATGGTPLILIADTGTVATSDEVTVNPTVTLT